MVPLRYLKRFVLLRRAMYSIALRSLRIVPFDPSPPTPHTLENKVASSLGLQTLRVDDGGKGILDAGVSFDRAVACFVGAIPHPDDWQVCGYCLL